MEVKRIEWINDVTYFGIDQISRKTTHYDLHLIPGAVISPSLLKIFETNSPASKGKWASDILPSDNVTVKFNPKIFPPPAVGDPIIKAWNMEINTDTGSLKINEPSDFSPPPHRLYNFIVEATVTDQNTNVITSEIRIHIHDSIKSAWLTPSVLSVRKNTDRHRFSILAEFSNRVSGLDWPIIGDISTLPGIKWERAPGPASVTVEEDTGHLTALSDIGSVGIIAKLPAPFNAIGVREGTVKSQKSWALLPAKVAPVPKRRVIESSIHKFPNVLFIPDGFKSGEEALFKKLVIGIVSKIENNKSLMPFNLLTKNKKINFWRAFIPSPDVGTSVLHYMTPIVNEPSFKRSVEIDGSCFAVKPDIESEEEWNLRELIYVVGLPLWFDTDMPDDNETYENKLDNWIARFNRRDIIRPRPGESPINTWKRKVGRPLWRKWKKMGRYLLFNERDTALGMSKGDRPNILMDPNDVRALSMHPFRAAREHLDMFLINLQADGITAPIGKIWGFPDVTGSDRDKGKDRDFVFVLCRGGPHAGARTYSPNPIVSLSIYRHSDLEVDLVTAPIECEIIPHPFSADLADLKKLSPDLVGGIMHEMAHIFPLGDEYGGLDSMPDTDKDQLRWYGNVQHRSELVSAAAPGISSRNIKWRWHRIEKVGILAQNPIELHPLPAQKLHIKLEPGQARRFLVGEHLFLRQRPLIKNPPCITSPELEVVDPENPPIPIDTIEVKVLPAGKTVNVVDFPGSILPDGTVNPPSHDSILFKPRSSTVDSTFELIVHKKILDQIDRSGGPLNAFTRASGNALRDCVAYVRAQADILDFTDGRDLEKFHAKFRPPNFPPNFLSHKIASIRQPSIIGIYESGSGYYCNVYHPAGMCLMNGAEHTSLCHVCRYILVDVIDPLSHGKLDAIRKGYSELYSRI